MKITTLKETTNGYSTKAKSFILDLYSKYFLRKLKKYGWVKKGDRVNIDWVVNIDISKENKNER
jgi:hypothetical protein